MTPERIASEILDGLATTDLPVATVLAALAYAAALLAERGTEDQFADLSREAYRAAKRTMAIGAPKVRA